MLVVVVVAVLAVELVVAGTLAVELVVTVVGAEAAEPVDGLFVL